jgi:hypothetical protein
MEAKPRLDYNDIISHLTIGRQYRLFEILKIVKELGYVGNERYKNSLHVKVEQMLYNQSNIGRIKRIQVHTPGHSNWGSEYRHEYIRIR